jgi:GNAT superfamily N-acetyltransferase
MQPPGTLSVRDLRRPVEDDLAVELLTDAFLDFPAMRVLVGHDEGARSRLRRLFVMEFDPSSPIEALAAESEGQVVGALTYVDSPSCTSVSPGRVLGFMRIAGPRVVRAMRMFGRLERAHPKSAHRHLPSIGVRSSARSQGVGKALMDAFHERCDRDGKVSYLETIRWIDPTMPSLERFYERLGYVVADVVPMTAEWEALTMIRRARIPARG